MYPVLFLFSLLPIFSSPDLQALGRVPGDFKCSKGKQTQSNTQQHPLSGPSPRERPLQSLTECGTWCSILLLFNKEHYYYEPTKGADKSLVSRFYTHHLRDLCKE